MTQIDATGQMEFFIQGEGIPNITLVKLDPKDTIADIVQVARKHDLSAPDHSEVCVFVENTDVLLDLDLKIDEAVLASRSRIHIHRCKEVEVTVNYNRDQTKGLFPPSATVDWVKEWAVGKDQYAMSPVDAAEHVLKVCNSGDQPDGEVHIGTLVKFPDGTVCFDLVPKQRIEG
ncbi:MAG: hypothetical protein F4Y80_01180 [Caldilineaceae bacterium SB0665_bin_21]|nr:hypothetical protein [Caldilineaceae bacterium SB0665_bin_21]